MASHPEIIKGQTEIDIIKLTDRLAWIKTTRVGLPFQMEARRRGNHHYCGYLFEV